MDDSTTFTFRCPKDLKNAFEMACKGTDRTGAQVLRETMRYFVANYMKEHTQADLLTPKKGGKK